MLSNEPSDKPSVWFSVLPTVLGLASFGAWIYFVVRFSDVLGLPSSDRAPLNIQLIIGIVIAFAGLVVFMVAGVIVGCLANVLICRYLLGWSSKEIRATFVRTLKGDLYDAERAALSSDQWYDTPRSRMTREGTRGLLNKINPALIKWLENDEKWRWLEGDE